MDDNQLNQYIKSLPKSVQDVLFNSDWENRTREVGKKYSLTDIQIDDLTNIVSLTLAGIQKPEDLLETIVSDVGISNLIAEQIVSDLENRVFEYALKQIEGNERLSITQQSKVPEIKPENLPMVEKGEGVKVNPPPTTSRDTFKPVEQSQKPYGVPRFGLASIPPKVEVINMNQNKPANSQNMMDNKLNAVTTNIPLDMQKKPEQKAETSPKIPTTKYNVDPYRESI